jgi:hypothetical protein
VAEWLSLKIRVAIDLQGRFWIVSGARAAVSWVMLNRLGASIPSFERDASIASDCEAVKPSVNADEAKSSEVRSLPAVAAASILH